MALRGNSQTFSASASADTYLSSASASVAKGGSDTLWVTSTNLQVNWTLILFDISQKLRPSDLVQEARILLTVSATTGSDWPTTITAGRLLTNWSESAVTWNTMPITVFDTATLTPLNSKPPAGAVVSIDVSKQLKRWHSYGGPSNFGTLLKITEGNADSGIVFASRENVQVNPPRLEVRFIPGPTTVYGYTLDPGTPAVAGIRVE